VLALLYKRTSKERRKGNPPIANNLSLYTLHLPSSNHPSCSEVPSKYATMILHTTNTTLISTTIPHHPTSQHLNPRPDRNELYRHHLATSSRHSSIPQRLHHSIRLIPSIGPIRFLKILQSITRNPNRDTFNLPRASCLRIGAIDLIPKGKGVVPPPIVHSVASFIKHLPHV